MNSDIENWIKSCELCLERKQPPNPVRAQLSSMPIASMPFERVSTDIMGPLPVSGPSKYQYVLVFICYFTKYVEFIPLSDIKASTVAKAFIENVLCRHGSPSFCTPTEDPIIYRTLLEKLANCLKLQNSYNELPPQCNGQSIGRKLNRPWVGPYYISQKLSEIHVKLRRKSDGKLLKNRVRINRLKRCYVWTNEPYDITPPLNEDVVEPAIISVDETQADFISSEIQTNRSQSQDNDTQNDNSDNTVFSVEKILRRKRIKGKWNYRVK
ncbi:unnamed protein product [Mytilus coruscus]|uniref:Integrase catalytic domain-containing protein n=1 Tax=Mytilus coruscus TaxID=42192 RepID=A0A6J8ACI7_MYTCO|nr:unnamed protein product [Mytilus coruscus]